MKNLITFSIIIFIISCSQRSQREKTSVISSVKNRNFPIKNGLFPIKEYGKWGYINSKGETIIKCEYDLAKSFSEGLAAILDEQKGWGFIDTTGKIIIEPKYPYVGEFSDGICNVRYRKEANIVNAYIKTNDSIAFISKYEKNISPFVDGRATVTINNEVCVIDKTGKIVFNTHCPTGGGWPPQDGVIRVWTRTGRWVKEGLSEVWTGDSTKYYNKNGELFLKMEEKHDNFKNGIAKVAINNKIHFINKKGEIKITPDSTGLSYSDFSEGLARAWSFGPRSETGFIDTTGKIVIPIKYKNARGFKEGLAAFVGKKGWGFIDRTGEIIIEPQFETVAYEGFSNGLCRAKRNNKWGYINYYGKFVWQEQTEMEYTKLDLSKWKLDTLEIKKPLYANKNAGSDNFPRKQKFPSLKELTLKVDTTDLTVFADKYFAHKVYLINASKDTINIPAQDGTIKIIQQAKNKNNEWQDIDNFINSFCGNSYHTLQLNPNEFQIFATPIFNGEFKTQLRFRLKLKERELYSNTYNGQINYEQLLDPKDKDKTKIAVWSSKN